MSKTAFAGQKILVTGASGFLGSHLVSRLSESCAQVHAVSRVQRSTNNSTHWWQGDMADVASARSLISGVRPNVIYHLAGLCRGVPDFDLVLPTTHSLLVSSINVLTAAKEAGNCRVVLAASLTEPEPDDAYPTPGSPYAAAKWASSGYARMFHRLYNLPVVMVRPFMTYGPAQDPSKIIPHVILSLLREEAPRLASGNQHFDWIYIDDVIDGFIAAADASDIDGRTIDLGSGVAVQIREIVARLVAMFKTPSKPLFGAIPDRPLERVRVANIADTLARLGWQPKTSLEVGLARTVEWYSGQLLKA